MKKIGSFIFTALFAAVVFSSCNDSDGDYWNNWAFATVQTTTDNDYYFTLDDSKTLYPSDKRRIGSYKATEGQRVAVYFNFLDPKVEGYDHNIALYGIQDVLTKDIKTITTEEDLEKIGDDRLKIVGSRIGGGFLTIQFGLAHWQGSKHEMNLIVNEVLVPGKTLEGYTSVEFRQRADSQQPSYSGYSEDNLVAFRLGDLDPSVTGSKGFYVRIRNMEGNVEYITVDLPKEK